MKKEKTSLLRSDSFQTLLSSLACILGGLILGYLVLLVIEPILLYKYLSDIHKFHQMASYKLLHKMYPLLVRHL